MENLIEFYKQTSMFTDLGKYKSEAIDLWQNKCHGSLKELSHYLMNVTIHRFYIQEALQFGSEKLHAIGDLSNINFKTPMCEDDIFLTASSIFSEIFRRDGRGFYIGRPFEKRLVLTCRYISVLTSAILKANGIPTRSRAGWARYFSKDKSWDHWVNEYWNEPEKRWVKFDMDDLYDPEFMQHDLYAENKIAYEYLDFGKDQFYSAADVWQMIRKDKSFVQKLQYGSIDATAEDVLKYLFLDFWAVMNVEYNYKFRPVAFDKKVSELTPAELTKVDKLAELMQNVGKNFDKLQKMFNEPEFRLTTSPLVDRSDYDLLIRHKNIKI